MLYFTATCTTNKTQRIWSIVVCFSCQHCGLFPSHSVSLLTPTVLLAASELVDGRILSLQLILVRGPRNLHSSPPPSCCLICHPTVSVEVIKCWDEVVKTRADSKCHQQTLHGKYFHTRTGQFAASWMWLPSSGQLVTCPPHIYLQIESACFGSLVWKYTVLFPGLMYYISLLSFMECKELQVLQKN